MRVVSAAFALCLAAPVWAQEAEISVDTALMDACVGAMRINDCIGEGAQACVARAEAGDPYEVEHACRRAERAYWEARVEAEIATLAARDAERDQRHGLIDGRLSRVSLLEAQREAFHDLRELRCDYEWTLWTPEDADAAREGCAMRETAQFYWTLVTYSAEG